jgi:glycosyltransferase involved in cell wall biosynthesis
VTFTDNLYIVIPAYNEEETIEDVAVSWHDIVVNVGKESRIVIVNDGSKDKTYSKLLELQKTMPQLEIVSKTNGGHGDAVLYGYNYAITRNADYIFQTDSDGQTLPSEFWSFWDKRAEYDMQIGSRKGRQDGLTRIIVSKVLKLVLFFQFGVWIKDANTPYRLMSRSSLSENVEYITKGHNLSNVLLTVIYYKRKMKVKFRVITFRPRQGGVNSINLRKIISIGINALKDFSSLKLRLNRGMP